MRAAYLARAAAEPRRIAVIDAAGPADEVTRAYCRCAQGAVMDFLSADYSALAAARRSSACATRGGAQRCRTPCCSCRAAGLGAEQLAHWVAALVLCESPAQRPCGTCPSCVLLRADNHPDFKRCASRRIRSRSRWIRSAA